MSVVETQTFRLADDADEAAFLAADRRVQDEFVWRQPGFVRRTTATGADGEWLVVVLWQSLEQAEAAQTAFKTDAAAADFMTLVDGASVRIARYTTLD
jgi:secreted protein with Ig-like and vWFA domain